MRYMTRGSVREEAIEQHIPLTVTIELTYKCNLKCIHCFNCSSSNRKELDFRELTSILRQLAKSGTLRIKLTGGEPLMRKDFFEIANYARKLGFAIVIYTNATLITEEVADKIAGLFPESVNISLYGPSEELYRRVTGRQGLFCKAIRGIRLLSEHRVPAEVCSQYFNFYSLDDVLTMKKIIEDFNLKWSVYTSFHIKSNGDLHPFKYQISESQYEQLCRQVRSARMGTGCRPGLGVRVCEDLRATIYINPYGQIGSCCLLLSERNVREKPLVNAWRKESILRKQREVRWKDMSNCLNCESRAYCTPCSASNYILSGSFNKTSPLYCKYSHMIRKVNERLKMGFKKLEHKCA